MSLFNNKRINYNLSTMLIKHATNYSERTIKEMLLSNIQFKVRVVLNIDRNNIILEKSEII